MNHLAKILAVSLVSVVSLTANAEKCQYDDKQLCALEAQTDKALAEYDAQLARRNVHAARPVSRQPYLDHYEPRTVCQPSRVMSGADSFNQWAGVSVGPTGMDCTTDYVPVYR